MVRDDQITASAVGKYLSNAIGSVCLRSIFGLANHKG